MSTRAEADQTSATESATRHARPDGPTPREMRAAMGRFATGVTVVTGLDDGEPVGFACQSFASVSLDPPLVLFCADHRGRAWPRIRSTGRFSVNVLAEHQTDLCDRFGSSRGTKFAGLDWTVTDWGTPALPDALMRLHADVHRVHVAGDHDVVIGRVLELETGTEHRPLLFYRGGFGVSAEPGAPVPLLDPGSWGWGDHWG